MIQKLLLDELELGAEFSPSRAIRIMAERINELVTAHNETVTELHEIGEQFLILVQHMGVEQKDHEEYELKSFLKLLCYRPIQVEKFTKGRESARELVDKLVTDGDIFIEDGLMKATEKTRKVVLS